MTKAEFWGMLDDILEQPIGTIEGEELLSRFANWDSLAIVSFIAACNGQFGVVLKGDDVKEKKSVPELAALVAKYLKD